MYRKDTKFTPKSAESFREVVIQFNKDKLFIELSNY